MHYSAKQHGLCLSIASSTVLDRGVAASRESVLESPLDPLRSLMSFWRTMDIRPQQLSGLVLLVQVYRYTGIPLNRGRSRKLGTSRGQCCQACEAKGIKMLFLVVMIFAAGFLGRAGLKRTAQEQS